MNNLAKLIILNMLIFASCAKEDEKPIVSKKLGSQQLLNDGIQTIEPKQFMAYTENKRPFLIYYAVDGPPSDGKNGHSSGAERFMNYTVDFETKKLREICLPKNSHVNWLILRNSDVAGTQTFEICNQGNYKKKSLKHFYDWQISILNRNFSATSPTISKCKPEDLGEYIEKNLGGEMVRCNGIIVYPHSETFKFDVIKEVLAELNISPEYVNNNPLVQSELEKYIKTANYGDVYGKQYPLINPYFLLGVVVNRILHPFHFSKYIPIWYFKSHGHFDYALTGLMPHQILEKDLAQKAIEEKSKAQNVDFKLNFEKPVLVYEESRKEQTTGSGLSLSQDNVCGLGTGTIKTTKNQSSESLGTSSAKSLGVNSLFIGNQPGITPENLIEGVTYSKNNENKDFFDGFERFESLYVVIGACDASITSDKETFGSRWFLQSENTKKKLKNLYAPVGSLSYRHYDWHVFFQYLGTIPDKNSHSKAAQNILKNTLGKTPNFVVDDGIKNEVFGEYKKIVDAFKTKVGNKK